MKPKRILKLVMTLAIASTVLPPRSMAFGYYIYGGGNDSCRKWIRTYLSYDIHLQAQNWVLGYLTAFGSAGIRMRETTSREAIRYIDSYCMQHPSDTIEKAAYSLVKQLAR